MLLLAPPLLPLLQRRRTAIVTLDCYEELGCGGLALRQLLGQLVLLEGRKRRDRTRVGLPPPLEDRGQDANLQNEPHASRVGAPTSAQRYASHTGTLYAEERFA